MGYIPEVERGENRLTDQPINLITLAHCQVSPTVTGNQDNCGYMGIGSKV